jgi:hypothetical protein
MPVILVTGRKHKIGDCGPGWPGQKVRPYLKNNQRIFILNGILFSHKEE